MKVLVKAVAAGAIGCAGLMPAAAAHAHAMSDPTLDSTLADAGIGTGALGLTGENGPNSANNAGAAAGNQVSSTMQTPVHSCGNAVAVGGFAKSDAECAAAATADADAPDCFQAPTMRSHGKVEKTAVPARTAKATNSAAAKYAGGTNGYGSGGANGGTGGNGGCSGGANGGYGGTGGSNGGGGGTGGSNGGGGGTGSGGTGGGGTGGSNGGGGTGGGTSGGGTGGSGGTGGGGGVSGGVSGGSGGAAGGVVGGGVSGGGVSGGTAGSPGGTLALTGVDSTSLTALGVTLIAGGSIALYVVRPRRRRAR